MTTAGLLNDQHQQRPSDAQNSTADDGHYQRGSHHQQQQPDQHNLQHPRLVANSQQPVDRQQKLLGTKQWLPNNPLPASRTLLNGISSNLRDDSYKQQHSHTDQDLDDRGSLRTNQPRRSFSIDRGTCRDEEDESDSSEDEDNSDEDSSKALLAVASAEEYAAKIIKLQQACLIPLKEDLADWLNKILKTSNMTTDNFMDNLDNGVIICRLAKIISLWCEQQLAETKDNAINKHSGGTDKSMDIRDSDLSNTHVISNRPLRSTTSQSINCLVSSTSATSLINGMCNQYSRDQFMDNLIKMHQTKIWEDAKCRTFYARDNVCNFIKWSKGFGVNQSVLFESDDLVLHANPRQVVLCLLDVARIAYVRYGFTEAPGLVKFEQEIDRELAMESGLALGRRVYGSQTLVGRETSRAGDKKSNDSDVGKKLSSRVRNSFDVPVDKTDELVMRYCRHKEEEAARKRSEELELATAEAAAASADRVEAKLSDSEQPSSSLSNQEVILVPDLESKPVGLNQMMNSDKTIDPNVSDIVMINSSRPSRESGDDDILDISSTTNDVGDMHVKNLADTGRIDSLDSGEGPTESASTGHSSRLLESTPIKKTHMSKTTSIPIPQKRTNFSSSLTSRRTSSVTHSELSSSRSSLLSNQDVINSTSKYGRPITSDLDGKVMRIAKSYYGKKATKDVTRLSEGKYKIADRIVFVRLLKGHRVMVRIGGGWDTLENFLFRHKSDPSQIIDPDNLLPLETKMPFDKSPQVTPTRASRLPYYRRSNSASTNNLSLSNLTISNHSLISSTTEAIRGTERAISKSTYSSPLERSSRQLIPHLSLLKNQSANTRLKLNQDANSKHSQTGQQPQTPQLTQYNSGPQSNIKRPFYYARRIK